MVEGAYMKGSVGIIGAGSAGLITGYTLLQDGFDVQLLTRDASPGGIWSEERVYPGLFINNVHGEYRFSPLEMPKTGGRLSGEDMKAYMSSFADKYLSHCIRYNTEVIGIQRDHTSAGWLVEVEDKTTSTREILKYSKLVLCTGGCSSPSIPPSISPAAAKAAGYSGLVLHSQYFRERLEEILARPEPAGSAESRRIVVVGGGKSAQDIAAYLANSGCKVTLVFETTGPALAAPVPLPDFLRRSRLLSILSPHIELRTRLERFFHTTWLGSKITHLIWNGIVAGSNDTLKIPEGSPLRNSQSPFWSIRVNDEGEYRENGFHALVNAGKIDLVSPARVTGYGVDGRSVTLSNGQTLEAGVVILATGYTSSWKNIFSKETMDELGLDRHAPTNTHAGDWNYKSLAHPPPSHPDSDQWASSIYRGIVPAKNIERRDFAINGAIFTTNNGYAFEVFSHWISAYFLGDKMRLPKTPEEAFASAERNAAWLRKRFPDMLLWLNESYSSNIAIHTWPQVTDEILDDLELPSFRSGGNWLTWPFKVIDIQELATLKQERDAKRLKAV